MPRVKRIAKRRRDYSSSEINTLMAGVAPTTRFGALHKGTADLAAMREAWEDLRDELLPLWIAAHPFSRPLGWLLFDTTQPRLRVVGEQAIEAAEFQATRGTNYRLCYFEGLNIRLGFE